MHDRWGSWGSSVDCLVAVGILSVLICVSLDACCFEHRDDTALPYSSYRSPNVAVAISLAFE